jgi:hypothetical protein
VLFVSLGELAGFTVPGLLGVVTQGMPTSAQVTALLGGGAVEGAMLGLAQALVLRRVMAGLRTAAWIGATAGAAAFAWPLGLLPSVTHATWTDWPIGWVVVAGAVLGLILLCSIGTAQALVMRTSIPKAYRWVGWTALGWCAGLTAFSAVAPPLWHEGQTRLAAALVGLAGGLTMAIVMAAVTGIGVLRLIGIPTDSRDGTGPPDGSRTLSWVLRTPVLDDDGRRLGRVRDLVIDLAEGLDRVPVTWVVVGGRRGSTEIRPWRHLSEDASRPALVVGEPRPGPELALASTEVLARRDILDTPVIVAVPPRSARVSDVVLDLDDQGAWVTGLDLSTLSLLRRLLGRATPAPPNAQVRLSEAHLVSSPAHAALLAVPDAMVLGGLEPDEMAEVLTRVPVAHARDILRVADRRVLDQALPLMHPHIRSRVTASEPAPRRTRRLAGWLLRRPRHDQERDAGAGSR